MYAEAAKKVLPNKRFRADWSDGDPDKEAKFYLLVKTHCPAILTENGFFDHYDEYKWMTSENGISEISNLNLETIKSIYSFKDLKV